MPKARRCAVYTRKSSEEGLEQDFNSLDAQREACEAYIKSQTGEGWRLIRTRYDDGGHSGGTLERPAIKALLADIQAGKIDTVVVYKVDRLTRSLADFAKIVEIFDACSVSFVSVTQQFNTTTSMGRLTLNMLLSFAQFEREVTGERIRDKIAASKKKGMWMGGYVPLGYEPDGRTLTVNGAEAETVRTVFELYREHGNVRRAKEEADRRGLTTKRRQTKNGRMQGGRPLSRGYIYKLLGNPLYAGRIAHRGNVYEGQHSAIIDPETWSTVQSMLAANTPERRYGTRVTDPSPLTSKLFDEAGNPLTPSHAVKSGRRYRYYVSRQLIVGDTKDGWRLPAREIERIVKDAITNLLANHSALTAAAREVGLAAGRIPDLLANVKNWKDRELETTERIDLSAERITLTLRFEEFDIKIRHVLPMRIKRRGVEMRLILESKDGPPAKPDAALIKAIARAHIWFDDLITGKANSLTDIAAREGVTDRYVGHLIPLAFLAPGIVESILVGTQPADLTAETLIKRTEIPLDWAEQRAILDFD